MFSNFSSWIESASSVIDSASNALNELADQGTQIINEAGIFDGLTEHTEASPPAAGKDDESPQDHKETKTEKVDEKEAALPGKEEEDVERPPPSPVSLALTKESVLAKPSLWENTEAEWDLLLHAALEHTSSFLVPPSRVVAEDDLWQSLVEAMHLDEKEAAHFRDTGRRGRCHYVPDEDMLAWIPTDRLLHAVFSLVVPVHLSFEEFFDVLGWKNALYHRCTNSEQLLLILKRLASLDASAAPHPETASAAAEAKVDVSPSGKNDDDKKEEEGGKKVEEEDEEDEEDVSFLKEKSSTAYWYDVEHKLDKYLQERKWFTGKENEIKEETRLAQDNLKLLESLVARQDAHSALAESVSESCSYHRKKLGKLEDDLRPDRERLVGTSLDLANGAALLTMRAVCEQLEVALGAFEKARSAPASPDKVESSLHASSAAMRDVSPSRLTDEDTSFEAKLPWDE